MALSWTLQTINGRDAILTTLKAQARTRTRRTSRSSRPRRPARVTRAGTDSSRRSSISRPALGRGDGILRLIPDAGDGNRLKAWTLLTALEELKGFGSSSARTARAATPIPAISADRTGSTSATPRNAYADRDPTVLVVGGGQCRTVHRRAAEAAQRRHADRRSHGRASATTGASAITR